MLALDHHHIDRHNDGLLVGAEGTAVRLNRQIGAIVNSAQVHICFVMEVAELQHLEAAMRDALAELYAPASAGERSPDLAELAQHVRELLELLDEGLADLPAESAVDTLREFARTITERLPAIERKLSGGQLQ